MSKTPEDIPVLGCSRSAPYTHADFSKDLQVYHLTNKHHPNQLYDGISTNFVNSIQLKQNPSEDYSHKMRNLYMDQLDHSLNLYKKKLVKLNSEADQYKRDYKQNVNTLLLYIEKDKNRRNQALNDCMKKMQQRQNRFIDANRIKNKRIDDYINRNQYFNSLNIAKFQFQQSLKNNQAPGQLLASSCPRFEQKVYIIPLQRQKQTSSIYCEGSICQNKSRKYSQNVSQSNQYGKQPRNKQIKSCLEKEKSNQKIYRVHNPITNPIQYHIDNPYFINKMQRKYNKNT